MVNPTTAETYVFDGVSGGAVIAIDMTSNLPDATIGVMPNNTATSLTGTFRNNEHSGFLEATTSVPTQSPTTRGQFLLNSQTMTTLTAVTDNLWRR